MADTFSSLLRLRMQQTGQNNNTWGALLNAAALQLIEDSIGGMASIVVAGSNVVLSVQNGANDQARMVALNLTGAPGAPRDIIVPALSKPYIVINGTDDVMTVKTAAGTGVAVASGNAQYVFCNGTNVIAVQAEALGNVATADNALALGGVLAANYARLDAFNQHNKGFATTFVALTDGAQINVDCTASNRFRVVLAGNRQLDLDNPSDGQTIEIWFVQDAGGGRTITWPANVRFGANFSATLSTGANAIDVYRLTYHESTDLWVAMKAGNASTASGASTFDVSLTANSVNLHLHSALGSPSGIVTVNFVVSPGVLIASTDIGTPAIDTRGFASGSIINLTTIGAYVQGRGGRGGRGSAAHVTASGNHAWQTGPGIGLPGGPAIYGPGAGRTLNIFNANGFIWGGGGGGGGGGATITSNSGRACGGGGGGGAGGGEPGEGGAVFDTRAVNGTTGSSGVNGALGGGSVAVISGGANAGAGGSGGDWGAAGSAGGNATAENGGAGGAAGPAVITNGATVNFASGGASPSVKGPVV